MPFTNANSAKATIMVVDDTPDNLTLIVGLLRDDYKIKVANSGEKALKIALQDNPPDLILLDIIMPELDGYEVCRMLKVDSRTSSIPVIFLTAKTDIEDERIGLEIGAVDYITKPVSPPILRARIKTHLQLKATADFLKDKNDYLETEVTNRTKEIIALQNVVVLALASLAEARDTATGNHLRRTQLYVEFLAKALSEKENYRAFLTVQTIASLAKSAPLHDIGKVGIPDHILNKTGRLTADEFEIMRNHSSIGRAAIERAELQVGERFDFLELAKEIAYSHHEKWDGSGYPEGISGDAIPISARIMALTDVYDALISERSYKSALSHTEAVAIISGGRGTHFDPEIVDTFLEVDDGFRIISERYSDARTN